MTLTDLLYYTLTLLIILAIFGVFWVIGGYILFRVVDRKLRRCPNCKRAAAGTIIESETEPLGIQVDRRGKEMVRIKSEKVIDHFQCDHCGHTWTRSFERKQPVPTIGHKTN